MKQKFSSIYL